LRSGPMGSWLPSALSDQHRAGGILWAAGDLVGLVFFVVLFVQWVRSSMREAAREDRRLDLLEARARRTEPTAASLVEPVETIAREPVSPVEPVETTAGEPNDGEGRLTP